MKAFRLAAKDWLLDELRRERRAFPFKAVWQAMIETFMLRKTDAKQVCVELAKEGLIANTWRVAIASITEYVNTAQKNPTDPTIMTQMIDNSGFYDSTEIKAVMTSPALREAMEYQVKFFMDLGKISKAPDLDAAIVTDLV